MRALKGGGTPLLGEPGGQFWVWEKGFSPFGEGGGKKKGAPKMGKGLTCVPRVFFWGREKF